jgi:hypothetical protein
VKLDNHELPPGFGEAMDKYPEMEPDSVEAIWHQLDDWRQFERKFPRSKAKALTRSMREESAEEAEGITIFQERILQAVYEDDRDFLNNLIKAMELPKPPEPKMSAYWAAVEAFVQLFLFDKTRTTREEWPTKKMVRERAEEILKKAGHPPKTNRHWPRVFKEVGLSDLPARRYKRT